MMQTSKNELCDWEGRVLLRNKDDVYFYITDGKKDKYSFKVLDGNVNEYPVADVAATITRLSSDNAAGVAKTEVYRYGELIGVTEGIPIAIQHGKPAFLTVTS